MDTAAFGVYISFPFCAQKCTYCNFASGVFPRGLEKRYLAALRNEIQRYHWQWTPETVYAGGGTPSLLEPDELGSLLAAIPGQPWREATLEAAPGTVTREKAGLWRHYGIERISLGAQSFVEAEIRRTGRKHTPEVVAADVAILRESGIQNLNVDLIAGLAGQSEASWNQSLDWIERLAPEHVSVYMLEIDADSRLGREILQGGNRYGAPDVPPGDLVADLYEIAVERLRAMGIYRYEISNFARPGRESRHNLKYWRLEPYIGFGADAHSFDGELRWQNAETAIEYTQRMERGESPRMPATRARRDEEKFFAGLRLDEGVQLSRSEWAQFEGSIRRFVDLGLLDSDGRTLRLTSRGVLVSNEVFQEFLAA